MEKYPKLFKSSPTVYKHQLCMNVFVTFHLAHPTPMIPIASSYTVQMKKLDTVKVEGEI